MQSMSNNSNASRAAWAARRRALREAGFAVDVFGNATTVFLLATCLR